MYTGEIRIYVSCDASTVSFHRKLFRDAYATYTGLRSLRRALENKKEGEPEGEARDAAQREAQAQGLERVFGRAATAR